MSLSREIQPPGQIAIGSDPVGSPVPIISIERETGLAKDVIRKWETRYGFPRPDRDVNGDRIYPADQVLCLRLIQRLMNAGFRPGKIVGLTLNELERLTAHVSPDMATGPTDFAQRVLDALLGHDFSLLMHLFKGQLNRQGLSTFVRESLAPLNTLIGESWLSGRLKVFEEHLYADAVQSVLYEAITTVSEASGNPRVLLTTAPGELHTLGILMANAVFAVEHACCIRLGAQTPCAEIIAAVEAYQVDIVGLSFSIAHPLRETTQFLQNLRDQLDPAVEIWVGGHGVSRLRRRLKGVRSMLDLNEIGPALGSWKQDQARG